MKIPLIIPPDDVEEIKTGQYPLEILNKPISYDKPKDIIILNEENAVKNESISLNESPIDNLENSILVENDVQESQDIFDITCSISSNTGEEIITSFSYDDNGNLIKLTRTQNNNTDITLYRYNELNQLIEYKNPQGISTTYTYYANGLRKTKTTGDETTTFYLDDKNVIIETKNGQLSARNIWGINPISRENENGNSLYYLYNGHADVVAMTDEESNVVNTYDYDVYGVLKEADEKGVNNPVRYAGEYYDEDSGLYYLRSRYYDPGLMRFINEDTYKGDVKDPLSLNLYTYCKGNPISYTDPSGHLVWWIPAVIGGIAGGIYSYVKTGKVQLSYVAQGSMLGMCIYGIGTAAYGTYKFYRMSSTTSTAEIAATEGAGKGFDNFNALKKNLGSAGEGKAWHHIVEQSQIQKSGFSPQQIHNTNNVIAVDSATHAKISGYYNSIDPRLSDSMRVRDWLAGQSFETQYQFGMDVLKRFGVMK